MSKVADIAGYSVHPAADIFPLIEGAEFDSFCEDIGTHGLMDPVIIDAASGQLIDGRNRVRACGRLGIEVAETRYHGADVVHFVISHNLHRRHLTDSQRAMIAGKLATRTRGGLSYERPPSTSEAAALLGVRVGTVGRAKVIHRDGTPDLVDLVSAGKAPVATAARVAELSSDQQDDYAARVNAGADPVATSPPDLRRHSARTPSARPPAPPKYGKRRKHQQVLEALATSLSGLAIAADDIKALDSSVTNEEASRLRADLLKSIKSLNRINNLLQERTK
jgi:hypothetical protein